MRPEATPPIHVLNSWKEISAFLGRGVRTVQRWERMHKLPIYRVGHGQRSPVFAYTSELSLWLHNISRSQLSRNQIPVTPAPANDRVHLQADSVDRAEVQHLARPRLTLELIGNSSRLTQNLLALTAQHQRSAAALMQTVDSLSSRLPAIARHLRARRKPTAFPHTKAQLSLAENISPIVAFPRKSKLLAAPAVPPVR